MSLKIDFSNRFAKARAFEETAIKAGEHLQVTRTELQEAQSEIDSLRSLLDENYNHAINSVMDVSNLLQEMNAAAPYTCIPFPKNRASISYAEKAGYIQYVSAFLKYVSLTMTERFAVRESELMQMTKMVAENTISESSIQRSGEIKLPTMADEKEVVQTMEHDDKAKAMIKTQPLTPPSSDRDSKSPVAKPKVVKK